jgi:hypothetical protein
MNLTEAIIAAFKEDDGPWDMSNYVKAWSNDCVRIDGEFNLTQIVERAIELMEVD